MPSEKFFTRPYQEEAIEKGLDHLRKNRSVLLVMATGTGKTYVFLRIADRFIANGENVLVLAHTDELITQACDSVEAMFGFQPEVEKSTQRIDHFQLREKGIAVGSIQTMTNLDRLERNRIRPSTFGLVIYDEAHRSTSDSYARLMEYFSEAKFLGVTATPRRSDGVALGSVFDTCAFQYGILQGIDEGFLVPVEQKIVECRDLDFEHLKSSGGKGKDFTRESMDRILNNEGPIHEIVAPIVNETAPNSNSLLSFCASVKHSEAVATIIGRYVCDRFNVDVEHALDYSDFLYGGSDDDVRKKRVGDFRSGSLKYLANCQMFIEGFDAPITDRILMARPTKSEGLYVQVFGRATRVLPGLIDGVENADDRKEIISRSKKPRSVIYDVVGISGRCGAIDAVDVLGGHYPDDVREYARRLSSDARKGITSEELAENIMKALGHAEAAKRLMGSIEKKKAKIVAQSVDYTMRDVPLGGQSGYSDNSVGREVDLVPPTKKQRGYLHFALGLSWGEVDKIRSKREAIRKITHLKKKKGIS